MNNLKNIVLLFVLVALASCHSNVTSKGELPRFARWELDSLTEISPKTLVAEGVKGTHLARKWSLTVIVEGTTKTEYPGGSYTISPNQSEIDKNQYIDFKENGSFELSVTDSACPELKDKVREMFGEEYTKPGIYHGTYKCYDVIWYTGEGASSYGVVLFNENGKELCRYAFCNGDLDGDFSLDKVEMKNPYRDDISNSIGFYLHKQ